MPELIRNRVTERDIRDWLQLNGYDGGSAILNSVELYAIKRPGWLQLFRFSGSVRRQTSDADVLADRLPVWGVALDDERKPAGSQMDLILCDCEEAQLERLSELSAGMITANKSADRDFGIWSLVGMALFCAAILFLIAVVKNLYE